MTPRCEPEKGRPESLWSERPDGDKGGELQLAQALIALHRSERAPLAVVRKVEWRLTGETEAERCRGAWPRRWDALLGRIAGWPVAGVVLLATLLLITWQDGRGDVARRRAAVQAEQRSNDVAGEVTLSGVALPGSLQWRFYGDDIGMGHCEGNFLLAPLESADEAAIRVHWTRCDLPQALSDELRRLFSPLHRAAPLPVTVRGHWAGAHEFNALGLRLQRD